MLNFAPLLAANADIMEDPEVLQKLVYPLWGSPKIDGIRCMIKEGDGPVSRKILPIPRQHVHEMFGHLTHMDGEIIVGNATDFDVYNRTQSYVMSKKVRVPEEIFFYVFDWIEAAFADAPYRQRYDILQQEVARHSNFTNLKLVPQRLLTSAYEVLLFESEMLELGYEGIMLRTMDGPYRVPRKAKENRSTLKEQILVKFKRTQDDEAVVIGFKERMHNENEAEKDAFGRTKRSSSASGLVPAGTLGKFVVMWEGQPLDVPPGVFTKAECQYIWDHQDEFMGKVLKFRHFPHGSKEKPRHQRAIGWRTEEDM